MSAVAAEVLATVSSKARVSSIALEALVSVADAPDGPTSRPTIVMVLGG